MKVIFSNQDRIKTFNIDIIADGLPEGHESFTLSLTKIALFLKGSFVNITDQEQERLILKPQITTITILDDNGKN